MKLHEFRKLVREEMKKVLEDTYVSFTNDNSITFDADSDEEAEREASDMGLNSPKKVNEANTAYKMSGYEAEVRELVKRYGKENVRRYLENRASDPPESPQLKAKFQNQWNVFQKMDKAGLLGETDAKTSPPEDRVSGNFTPGQRVYHRKWGPKAASGKIVKMVTAGPLGSSMVKWDQSGETSRIGHQHIRPLKTNENLKIARKEEVVKEYIQPGSLDMKDFIEMHRKELYQAIKKVCPNCHFSWDDDDEIENWIQNDEGLYNWAKSEGVRMDENIKESILKEGTNDKVELAKRALQKQIDSIFSAARGSLAPNVRQQLKTEINKLIDELIDEAEYAGSSIGKAGEDW